MVGGVCVAVLKVGLIGLGRGGRCVANALLNSNWCELVAVGSDQARRTEAFVTSHPGIAAYNDFRSLIVENPLDALFVATPPHQRGRYLTLAAERRLPVWMLTPAARRFDEAIQLISQFERIGCPLVVSRSWGLEPALQPDAVGLEQLGRLFFAHGQMTVSGEDNLDWRGDLERAGGGVLLYRGYPLLDTLVQIMGMPGTVFARAAGVSRPGTRFPYDTDDTAALVCRFPGGGIAMFGGCWTTGPAQESLHVYGTGGNIHIAPTHVVVRDRAGEQVSFEESRPVNPLAPQIEDFLSALASSARRMRATLRQHLSTLAVIQAAYLSARTGQPESPRTIFDMHQVTPEPKAPSTRT
jgi:predicted dehydrogenase